MPETPAAGQTAATSSTPTGSAGNTTSTPAVAATQGPGPAAASSPQAGATGAATTPAVAATAAGGGPPASPQAQSFRDILAGVGPSGQQLAQQYQDDRALAQYLLAERERAQQLQPYAPYAQQYAQHAAEFQQFLAQRQADAQRARDQQQNKPWWAPHWQAPEYDPNWESMVRTDEHGNVVPGPGAPPDVAAKYLNALQFRQQQAKKFLDNPYTFLEPGIKTLAQQVAEQAVQQHLGGYRDQVFAQNFTQQNAGWLYQQTQDGRVATDPFGQPLLSPQGQQFAGYVRHASERMGLQDVRAQQEFALAMVQRDWYAAQVQQQQAASGQARQQANQQFLQNNAGANNIPPAGGSVPRGAPAGVDQGSQNRSQTIGQRLRAAFAAEGVTDQVLQQQMVQAPGAR